MSEINVSNFTLDYRISNHSNKELVVKTKGGFNYVIRKCREVVCPGAGRRILFLKIKGVRNDSIWFDKTLARSNLDKQIIKLIEEDFFKRDKDTSLILKSFSQDLSYQIELIESLADDNDVIQSDILGFSLFASSERMEINPLGTPEFTLGELFAAAAEAAEDQDHCGLHYFIYLNDPLNNLEPLYTNVMGKPVQVPVARDGTKPGGLYIGLSIGDSLPQRLYYSFDSLSKEELLLKGIFQTKEECSNSAGNTERVITAEGKLKERNKEINGLLSDKSSLTEALSKSEKSVSKLAEELMQVKEERGREIQQLKNDHRMDQMKNHMTSELLKAQGAIRDTVSKANMELDRKRSTANNWGEVAKAIAAISTIVVTGYKLYTS